MLSYNMFNCLSLLPRSNYWASAAGTLKFSSEGYLHRWFMTGIVSKYQNCCNCKLVRKIYSRCNFHEHSSDVSTSNTLYELWKFVASIGVINISLCVKTLKCYHNYPSTSFVRILGRPSLHQHSLWQNQLFIQGLKILTFTSLINMLRIYLVQYICHIHSLIYHTALSTIFCTCPRSVKNSTYWVIQHIQRRQRSDYLSYFPIYFGNYSKS